MLNSDRAYPAGRCSRQKTHVPAADTSGQATHADAGAIEANRPVNRLQTPRRVQGPQPTVSDARLAGQSWLIERSLQTGVQRGRAGRRDAAEEQLQNRQAGISGSREVPDSRAAVCRTGELKVRIVAPSA